MSLSSLDSDLEETFYDARDLNALKMDAAHPDELKLDHLDSLNFDKPRSLSGK